MRILEENDILINKPFLDEPSQFKPENLLREARRQRNIQDCPVPKVCMLDPDGDIVDYLLRSRKVQLNSCWSCYHTKMYEFNNQGASNRHNWLRRWGVHMQCYWLNNYLYQGASS